MSALASATSRSEHALALQRLALNWLETQPQSQIPAFQARERAARAHLQTMRFPDRKTENWKYTALNTLNQSELWQPIDAAQPKALPLPNDAITLDCAARLVLRGGSVQLISSSSGAPVSADILEVRALESLNADEQARYLPKLALGETWQTHPFVQLCEANLHKSWVVIVKSRQILEKPIVIEQWFDSATATTNDLRVLVVVESEAQATLVQITDSSENAAASLQMSLLQIHLHDNAQLQHVQLQLADEQCQQICTTQTQLGRDARYRHYNVLLGTNLLRNDLHLLFNDKGAEAELYGAFLSKHNQHVDNHLNLEHVSGYCQSTTQYKGLVTDRSRAIFNGRIHIHPHAIKTDAQLNNKNLLLSREAEIDTKPELEIYADDVKCAHGASIGQLDDRSLFYFESRGIDRSTAEAMLSFGFINEIIEKLPIPSLVEASTSRLMRYFRDVKQLGALWQE
ncbi:FeS assembly protein [gamma proteobacterium HdN1]|nr:FeS assembly protein [gamma proteobacterium HdN1]